MPVNCDAFVQLTLPFRGRPISPFVYRCFPHNGFWAAETLWARACPPSPCKPLPESGKDSPTPFRFLFPLWGTQNFIQAAYKSIFPMLPMEREDVPALAGLCGSAGETVFRWRAGGCCGDNSRGSVNEEVTNEGVTKEPPGLLNGRAFWLVTGTVTGMAKLGAGTEDCRGKGQKSVLNPGNGGARSAVGAPRHAWHANQSFPGSATQEQEGVLTTQQRLWTTRRQRVLTRSGPPRPTSTPVHRPWRCRGLCRSGGK